MKDLFEAATAVELKQRLERLTPQSPRQWGRMNAAQAMAHCAVALEMASGKINPSRAPIGRLIGWVIKPLALGDDKPIRRNSPTIKELLIADECDLTHERERLAAAIDQFAAAGPSGCTRHPHAFFGKLTPAEWAILMYKHVDHHLRQFGI